MTAKDLKNALLQEAVQGKLVPQKTCEGNARDLLEEIRKARGESDVLFSDKSKSKTKLVSEASLPLATARKRSSATPSAGTPRNAPMEIPEDEIPFDIPESWCWCRLGEIIRDKPSNGISPKEVKYETKIKSLSLSATTSGYFNSNAFKYVELDENLAKKYFLKKYDLLIQRSNSRDFVGTSCIYKSDDNVFIYPDLMMRIKLEENIDVSYIDFVLKSPYIRNYYSKSASGTSESMPKINQGIVCNTVIPLPPPAEQKRIVAALEKFMPLIEEYGKKETVLNQLNAQIGTLTKKAILQEAVQGKLVPQIPAEGNAKDLLEQIKAQKAALIKEGKIKKEKPLPEITEDEIPFDIPENWCWCRLGECINEGHQGINTAGDHVQFVTENGVPIIQTGDITQGFINIENTKLMSFVDYDFYKEKYQPQYNDIFFCNIGTLGKPVIYRENFTMLFHWNLFIVKYNSEKILPEYLQMYFENCVYDLEKKLSGTALKFISKKVFLEMLVPLPPLSEQKRIVEAIEKLLPLCEKLGK